MPIYLANAPVSWGIYEFDEQEQLYPYTQVLDEIAETGYKGMEYGPWGYLPSDPDVLREELAKRDLQMLSSFVPVALRDPNSHAESEAHALKVGRVLAALDAQYVVLADDSNTVPELTQLAGQRTGSYLDDDEWDVVAQAVNRIAQSIFDETGLKTVFHHHCASYVETPEETRKLMERTDHDLVGLCLDTGHWHYGGGDALDCIEEYGERVRYLHLKDYDPVVGAYCRKNKLAYFDAVEQGLYCELGKGEVNFPDIIEAMENLGYDGWAVVEQDILVSDLNAPKEFAIRNREYLESIGL